MSTDQNGSIVGAMFWMFLISLLLFWLPVIGPLLAGVVGGKKAGGIGAALMAVFLPGILLGVGLFLLASSMSGLPIVGAIVAGAGGVALALMNVGPLLLGAVIGALLAE